MSAKMKKAEVNNLSQELGRVKYGSYAQITAKINELAEQYGNMPIDNLMRAFGMIGMNNSVEMNPYSQNRRVKHIGSAPSLFSKKEVDEMLQNPESNELPIRKVTHALEYTSYPFLHTRLVYQDLLTYHSYVAPYLTNKGDAKRDDFWREWKLLEKLRTEFGVKQITHEITGQALQEGKVFYYPRYSVDKAHNKVNHAFMQQLPSDYVKIVGFNNKSKYTLAFNMMYFTQEGTDVRQYGDLFFPYLEDFNTSIMPAPKGLGTKLVYAAKTKVNMNADLPDGVEAYCQNGKWFYWVMLPIDKVFTFEVDEVPRTVMSPFTGLITDMLQLSQLEALQMELLSNPLVAVLTGEMPYYDQKDSNGYDNVKMSNAQRLLFTDLWNQLTMSTNTGGIGIYMAPLKNMKLESLPEAPNATNIVSSGYRDVMNKAGLSGIIPTSDDARSGLAQISFKIESQFAKAVYRCMERMMNVIIEKLNLKYDWRFYMFGDIESDDRERDRYEKEMTLGLLPSAIMWNAMNDRSILEDISWSDAVMESDILEKRIPLISGYSAKAGDRLMPPTEDSDAPTDEGGRPRSEGTTSEGQEADTDSYGFVEG